MINDKQKNCLFNKSYTVFSLSWEKLVLSNKSVRLYPVLFTAPETSATICAANLFQNRGANRRYILSKIVKEY